MTTSVEFNLSVTLGRDVPAPNRFQLSERIKMFTDQEIRLIIAMRNTGSSLEDVARLFNTDRLTIRQTESKFYRSQRENANAVQ
jgi:DNA-directed RNA polymerase sigma subunit (sigma70/sigma32)